MATQTSPLTLYYVFDDTANGQNVFALPYDHPKNAHVHVSPSLAASAIPPVPMHYLGDEMIEVACKDIFLSNAFNAEWYLQKYPDIANENLDPLLHYVAHGASEGRDPCSWFYTKYYLQSNPDIQEAKLNPFHHYVLHGWREGRAPNDLHMEEGYAVYISSIWNTTQNMETVLSIHERAINDAPTDTVKYNRHVGLGTFCMNSHHWPHAEEAFKNAILTRPDVTKNYDLLACCLRRQGKWWQEINALEKATTLEGHHAAWWHRLGEAREAMERWEAAAEAYQQAINLDGKWPEWHYRLGFVFERSALMRSARVAYAKAIELDKKLDAKLFGIGVFHQNRGYWGDARKAYEAHLRANPPGTPELHAKIAIAHHRCYDMQNAAIANFNVLTTASGKDLKLCEDAYYRLGITNERMGKLELAERAYACSLENTPNRYRRYRQGYVLAQMERYKEACEAYLKLFDSEKAVSSDFETVTEDVAAPSPMEQLSLSMANETVKIYTRELEQDTTRTELYFAKGAAQEILGDMEGAAESYAAGMARQNDHCPEGWYRLGKALHACGRFAEACEAFANVEILRKPYWVDRKHYNSNTYFKLRVSYVEYCETLPISSDLIFYESFTGHRIGDSPYALFREILQNDLSKTHVWAVRNREMIREELKSHKNIIFILHNSNAYIRYLATAKIIITDSVLQPYFIRREGQTYLNTWHGTPMKSLGKDILNERFLYGDMQRNFMQTTHMIHQNEFSKNKINTSYDLGGIMHGEACVTGYPRTDLTLNANKQQLKTKLNLPEGKTVIFYAPTWRGYRGNIDVDTNFISDVVNVCNRIPNSVLIFRAHSMMERVVESVSFCNMFPESVTTNELLAISDVLITDYSSICFDFMATMRPIIYYINDIDEYAASRGMYLSPEELPGIACRTLQELEETLMSLPKWKVDSKYIHGKTLFCGSDDGNSSKRAIEFLNKQDDKTLLREKTSILFYIDLIPNGIGMSFISLCNSLDRNKYDISILLNKDVSLGMPLACEMLNSINDNCRIFMSDRSMNYSLEEWHDRTRYVKHTSADPVDCKIVSNIYEREFARIFGKAEFDILIDFVGYSCHQSELFAFAPCKKRIIFLHNDMHSELKNRFNYLKRIFHVYKYYDKIVSVSDSINEINKANLATAYSIDVDKFVTVPNMQRPEYVKLAAKDSLEAGDESLFSSQYRYFITLGRLSPEKNQSMLLEAFAWVHKLYPDTRFLILGQGPLRQELQRQIEHLGLNECVFLLGHKQNPYPYLLRSDCFVLPSKYEGQPVVFYEAFALNIPVIATNIPASNEVLENGRYGLLTDLTSESLALGMKAFLLGNVPKPEFDFNTYQTNAMLAFEALL